MDGTARVTFTPYPREHGTDRGYQQHRQYAEPACASCKAAHVRHNYEGDKRRRENRLRPCHQCGGPIPLGRRSYCDDECKRLARNARDRAARRPRPRVVPAEEAAPKPGRWIRRGLILVPAMGREAS